MSIELNTVERSIVKAGLRQFSCSKGYLHLRGAGVKISRWYVEASA
jgi:hypothetical protein